MLILAALHGALTIPLHAAVLRQPDKPPGRTRPRVQREHDAVRRAAVRRALHDRGFWLLAVAFLAQAAATSTLTVHLVAYLVQLGHPATFAATIAGLLGVLSVTGRLTVTGLQRRAGLPTVVAAVFTIQAAAASLPLLGHTTLGAVTAVVGFGLGFGVATIARPAMLAARYDTTGYATISGILTVPLTIAKAAAPLGAAALYTNTGSYTPVLAATAAACLIASVAITASRHISHVAVH